MKTRAARRMGGVQIAVGLAALLYYICSKFQVIDVAGSWKRGHNPLQRQANNLAGSSNASEGEAFDASKNYVEEIRMLKRKLETTERELASAKKLQQATMIERQRLERAAMSAGDGAPNNYSTDGGNYAEPDESHRFEHIVTTSKLLNQSLTKNLLHMDPVMRRSRPVVGNTERMHGFIHKLLDGKCTNVLFVGGSVTFAFPRKSDGSLKHGYHLWFVGWLNEQYPCNDGGEHKLIVHGIGGTDSSYAVNNFNQLFRDADGPVDFVSFEYAVNDGSMLTRPGRTLGETIQITHEILFRKALKYRNPQDGSAPAVISLETSFWVGNMMQKRMSRSHDAVQVFSPAYHFPIMTYYDVPSISAAQVWFPMFAKDMGRLEDHDSEISNVFADMCHPSDTKGHFVVAQLLAYNVEIEKAWMLQGEGAPRHRLERDLTLQDPPKLPDPWWLTDEEEALAVDAPVSEFDFQKCRPTARSLNRNTGWSVLNDSAGKNKFGLIATKSASHVSFKVDLLNFNRTTFEGNVAGGDPRAFKQLKRHKTFGQVTPTNKLSLGYLVSYANVSDAMVWTDDDPDGRDICRSTVATSNSTAELECVKHTDMCYFRRGPGRGEVVSTKNRFQTSVFNSYTLSLSESALDAAERGKPIYLHACSLPFDFGASNRTTPYTPVDGDSKFKLLLVMAINGRLGMKKSGYLH